MSCLLDRFVRLRSSWIVLVCLAPWFVPGTAGAHASGPVSAAAASAQGSAPPALGARKKGKRRKHGKLGNAPGRSTAVAHRRERRHSHGATAAHPPKLALLQSPGPAQTPDAARAMDKVRRMQIERAEDAARRQDMTNRWETVNFLISGVDEQRYPEAGFWKVLSCYRRGRIDEGDSARQRCRLSAADARALDGERSVALLLASKNGTPNGTPTREDPASSGAATGVPPGSANNAAYTGPRPMPAPISGAAP